MRTRNVVLLALAAVVAWVLLRSTRARAVAPASTTGTPNPLTPKGAYDAALADLIRAGSATLVGIIRSGAEGLSFEPVGGFEPAPVNAGVYLGPPEPPAGGSYDYGTTV